jgi:glycosyltransferase involved in cell wall biosynthesis
MGDRVRVCLVVEGSYPFITGGVSAWIQELIKEIPQVDFVLFTISPEPDQEMRYELPENVVGHRDIVISQVNRSRGGPSRRRSLAETIRRAHDSSFSRFEELIEKLPAEGLSTADLLRTDIGWDMLVRQNQRRNPVYPFTDYFWSWKSSHEMMLTVLGADLPEADLYHAVSTGYAGLTASAAKVRRGKPFLLTEHGLYHKEREMEISRASYVRGYQKDMWTKIYNRLSQLSYQQADLIISLFEYNRRMQIELGAREEKTLIIPNGIDTRRYAAVERKKRQGFHVGLVGRVVPIKDIKTFISVARIVASYIPDASFYCIGPTDEDPEYFEDCQRLVKSLKMNGSFHFTGRADVRDYYAFLDVLLLTSIREAQPLVILEAFCAGVPVVSTRVGNVPELLGFDDRFMTNSKDPDALATAVRFVHENAPEIAAIVEKNRERVLKFYDRQTVFDRYRELYEEFGAR